MTSIAPGSPGPYSDRKRAKSPWDPRDVPIQLLPLSGPSSLHTQNSLPEGPVQPLLWISSLDGVDVQAGMSTWAGMSAAGGI